MGNPHGSWARRIKHATPIVCSVTLIIAVSACSSSGGGNASSSNGNDVQKIAIVTPETESDHGWNQQGLSAAKKAAKKEDVKLITDTDVGYDNTQTTLTQVAKRDVQLVFAHASGYTTAATRAAKSADVPMVTFDDSKAKVPGKVGAITFAAEQGGYLAGVAAASSTKTGKLGLVLSAEDINWFTQSAGFIQGARSVDPDIKITRAYVGSDKYDDSSGGKKVMNQVISSGADVVMGMGNGTTVGYLSAIESSSKPVKYISTIGSVSDMIDDQSKILTSVRWNFEPAYVNAIKNAKNGDVGKKTYNLTLANRGFALKNSHGLTAKTKHRIKKAKKNIVDGSTTVKRATTKKDLDAMLKKK